MTTTRWKYSKPRALVATLPFGAPEAEMDLPYGHMAQNTGYAMIAQRYAATYV